MINSCAKTKQYCERLHTKRNDYSHLNIAARAAHSSTSIAIKAEISSLKITMFEAFVSLHDGQEVSLLRQNEAPITATEERNVEISGPIVAPNETPNLM